MRIIGDELKMRNRYIGLLNRCEADINAVINQSKLNLINPIINVKRKIHEMEDLFHNKEMEFYTHSSSLGKMIKNHLLWYSYDMINTDLTKVINFELAITIIGIRLPIKNPFIDNFNKKNDEIKNFKIDEALPEKLAKYATEEDLREIFFIDDNLIRLGYSDLAKTAVHQTIEAMSKGETPHQKKKVSK